MMSIETTQRIKELSSKYDKYSHMTKNGTNYLLYIFLKKSFTSKEFELPIVAFFCHKGKLFLVDEGQDDYDPEDINESTLGKFLNYIEDCNNLYSQEYKEIHG